MKMTDQSIALLREQKNAIFKLGGEYDVLLQRFTVDINKVLNNDAELRRHVGDAAKQITPLREHGRKLTRLVPSSVQTGGVSLQKIMPFTRHGYIVASDPRVHRNMRSFIILVAKLYKEELCTCVGDERRDILAVMCFAYVLRYFNNSVAWLGGMRIYNPVTFGELYNAVNDLLHATDLTVRDYEGNVLEFGERKPTASKKSLYVEAIESLSGELSRKPTLRELTDYINRNARVDAATGELVDWHDYKSVSRAVRVHGLGDSVAKDNRGRGRKKAVVDVG